MSVYGRIVAAQGWRPTNFSAGALRRAARGSVPVLVQWGGGHNYQEDSMTKREVFEPTVSDEEEARKAAWEAELRQLQAEPRKPRSRLKGIGSNGPSARDSRGNLR